MTDTTTHDCHRKMAAELFNRTWDLLDASDRSADADRELLASVYGSYAHWRCVGQPKNLSVSDWQVSRVWAVLGDPARAADHGAEALRIAAEHELGPFYLGYGHEALARAAAVAGDAEAMATHLDAAVALLPDIGDEESAALLQIDLEAIRALGDVS